MKENNMAFKRENFNLKDLKDLIEARDLIRSGLAFAGLKKIEAKLDEYVGTNWVKHARFKDRLK